MNGYSDIIAQFVYFGIGVVIGMGIATLIHAMALASIDKLDE